MSDFFPRANLANDCQECYYGRLNWTSHIKPDFDITRTMMNIAVFPVNRFTSSCFINDNAGMNILYY